MNSIDEKSTIETLKNYFVEYKNIFYKRSFENFVVLIMSILYIQEAKSVKFLYEKFIKKYWDKCLNSFYYFLSDKNLNITNLAKSTLKTALKIIPEELKGKSSIYLIIDDTLQSKHGKKFDCYSKLFDHTAKNGTSYLNGHCFVSLALAIPVIFKGNTHYIKIPVQYKLYDGLKSKMELAANMVIGIAPILEDYQVIVLCDSWYTKSPFIQPIKSFENIDVIGAVRKDTAIYNLKPKRTGKRGRPKTKGDKLDYRKFSYIQEDDYFIAHARVLTNLYDKPVYITVTTTDINKFSSARIYLSTICPRKINSFDNLSLKENKDANKPKSKTVFNIYKMRWNIEVIFYQTKSFWSFGNYMVRRKEAIEKYVNLIGVAYSLTILLPFMSCKFSELKFQSPQEIKYYISECISKELIYDKLLKTIQLDKNITTLEDVIEHLNNDTLAS
ncbi:MAG: IS701 family transposase [Clostridium sp.]